MRVYYLLRWLLIYPLLGFLLYPLPGLLPFSLFLLGRQLFPLDFLLRRFLSNQNSLLHGYFGRLDYGLLLLKDGLVIQN